MLIRLQRYVLRELLMVFLLAATTVSLLITLGLSVQLIGEGLMPAQLRSVFFYLIPFTWPFAVPSGLLISCVMVFGRLAGDNELLAIRSSGVSLWRVIWPVLALGLMLTAASVYLNNNVLPWCHRQLETKQRELIGPMIARLGSSRERIELPPYVIHIGGIDPEDHSRWQWVVAAKYARNTLAQVIMARTGHANYHMETDTAELILTDGVILHPFGGGESQIRFPEDIRYTIDLSDGRSDPYHEERNGDEEEGYRERIPSDVRGMQFGQLLTHRARLTNMASELEPIPDPRDRRRKLEREHANIILQVRRMAGELSRPRERLAALDEEERAILAQIQSIDSRRRHLDGEIDSRAMLLRNHESRILEIRSLLITLQEDSARAEEQRERLREQERRRDEIEAIMNDIRVEISEGEARVEQINARLRTIRASRSKEQEAMAELEGEMSGIEAQASDAGSKAADALVLERLRRAHIEVHFRLGQSVACLVFVLVGIPFGIMVKRGGIIAAFGISFGVVLLLYFPVYSVGRQLAEAGQLPAYIALWMPNAICGVVGLVFLWLSLRR